MLLERQCQTMLEKTEDKELKALVLWLDYGITPGHQQDKC